jgi:hypothetical protein
MKFATLLMLFLTFSQIALSVSGAVSRSHRFSSRRTHTRRSHRAPADNKWYQLFFGVVKGLSGVSDKEMAVLNEKCLPESWKGAVATSTEVAATAAEDKSTWTKILDGISVVLKFICFFKVKIKDLFAGKVARYVRRRKHRMFVQSMARYKKAMWFWEDVAHAISSAWGSITNMLSKAWNEVKEFAGHIFTNMKAIWTSIVDRIKGILASDFVQTLKTVFQCAKGLGDVIKGIIKVITATVERIADIVKIAAGDVVALASVIIDLICNFDDFREAVNKFIDGIHETNTLKKYNDFGQFFGILFKALMARRIHQ